MTTIILKTSTDEVVVDFDDQAEIIWTDELRTAYEYDVAIAAMGGTTPQLGKFVEKWGAEHWEHGELAQIREETMLYKLPSTYHALMVAVEYMHYVVDIIYPGWSTVDIIYPGWSTRDTYTSLSEEDSIIIRCAKATMQFMDSPDIPGSVDGMINARDELRNYLRFHSVDSVVLRDLMRSCEFILGILTRPLQHLHGPIVTTPHNVKDILDGLLTALVLYRVYGGISSDDRLSTRKFFATKEKERTLLLQRLISAVHDAQLERVPGGSP